MFLNQDSLQVANKLFLSFQEMLNSAKIATDYMTLLWSQKQRGDVDINLNDSPDISVDIQKIIDLAEQRMSVLSLSSSLVLPVRCYSHQYNDGQDDIKMYGITQHETDDFLTTNPNEKQLLDIRVINDTTVKVRLKSTVEREVTVNGANMLQQVNFSDLNFDYYLSKFLQNQSVIELFSTVTELMRKGKLDSTEFVNTVKSKFNGLQDEAYSVFKDLVSSFQKGEAGVLAYIKTYYAKLKSGVASEEGWSFSSEYFVTSTFDAGLVLDTLGNVFSALSILLVGVSRIAAAISALVSGVFKAISWFFKKDYDESTNVQVVSESPNYNFVNPLIQCNMKADNNGIMPDVWEDATTKYSNILKENGSFKMILPGLEGWIWLQGVRDHGNYISYDSIALELFPSLRWSGRKLFSDLNFSVTTDSSSGTVMHNWSTPSLSSVKNWCTNNAYPSDTEDNDEVAERLVVSLILYMCLVIGPEPTLIHDHLYSNYNNLTSYQKFETIFVILLEWLRKKYDSNYTPPRVYLQQDFSSVFAFLTKVMPDISCFVDDFSRPVSELKSAMYAYDPTGSYMLYQNFFRNSVNIIPITRVNETVAGIDDASDLAVGFDLFPVLDRGADRYYPPKYTRAAKIMGYVISGVVIIATAVAAITVAYKANKYIRSKTASLLQGAESAWEKYKATGSSTDYNNYLKAAKKNNRWAKLTGGTTLNVSSYWAGSEPTEGLVEKASNKVKDALSQNADEQGDEGSLSLLDIYHLIAGVK